MQDETTTGHRYEPPSIEERIPVAAPLVAVVGSAPVTAPSAVFRPAPSESYEAPCIEARDPIGLPLIGGPGTSSLGISAAFRP